jgi:predicted transposase YbfD/YdcC
MIDGLGCQKEIAKKIIDSKADYLLAVKDNQRMLADAVTGAFEEAFHDRYIFDAGHPTKDKGHGRIEIRRCWTLERRSVCQREILKTPHPSHEGAFFARSACACCTILAL